MLAGTAMTRAGCWSHARRKFVEAEKTAPEIAREAVDWSGRLFAVEKQGNDVSVAERLALRPKQSVPVLAELRQKLLPKDPTAEAVNYTLGQWGGVECVFTAGGAVPVDNNVSEREMKRVVLNRKNSLFVGNPRGGRTAAILARLTSRRRTEMDPQLYFMQLLLNFSSWPANDIDAWLPDRWKQAHAVRCDALEIHLSIPENCTALSVTISPPFGEATRIQRPS